MCQVSARCLGHDREPYQPSVLTLFNYVLTIISLFSVLLMLRHDCPSQVGSFLEVVSVPQPAGPLPYANQPTLTPYPQLPSPPGFPHQKAIFFCPNHPRYLGTTPNYSNQPTLNLLICSPCLTSLENDQKGSCPGFPLTLLAGPGASPCGPAGPATPPALGNCE